MSHCFQLRFSLDGSNFYSETCNYLRIEKTKKKKKLEKIYYCIDRLNYGRIVQGNFPETISKYLIFVFFLRTPLSTFELKSVMSGKPSAINDLLRLCRDEQQGLSFVKDGSLPEYTFVAIEAIWWSIEHCDDVRNEQIALDLFQVNVQNKKTE